MKVDDIYTKQSGIASIALLGFYLLNYLTTSGDRFLKLEKELLEIVSKENQFVGSKILFETIYFNLKFSDETSSNSDYPTTHSIQDLWKSPTQL